MQFIPKANVSHRGNKCVCPREVSRALYNHRTFPWIPFLLGIVTVSGCSCLFASSWGLPCVSPLHLAHFGLPQPGWGGGWKGHLKEGWANVSKGKKEKAARGCIRALPGKRKHTLADGLWEQLKQRASIACLFHRQTREKVFFLVKAAYLVPKTRPGTGGIAGIARAGRMGKVSFFKSFNWRVFPEDAILANEQLL